MKRKKTEIVKKSNNPAFQVEIFFMSSQKSKRHQRFFPQESFNFKADEKDIETFGVRVTAMQHLNFPEKGKTSFCNSGGKIQILCNSIGLEVESVFY